MQINVHDPFGEVCENRSCRATQHELLSKTETTWVHIYVSIIILSCMLTAKAGKDETIESILREIRETKSASSDPQPKLLSDAQPAENHIQLWKFNNSESI